MGEGGFREIAPALSAKSAVRSEVRRRAGFPCVADSVAAPGVVSLRHGRNAVTIPARVGRKGKFRRCGRRLSILGRPFSGTFVSLESNGRTPRAERLRGPLKLTRRCTKSFGGPGRPARGLFLHSPQPLRESVRGNWFGDVLVEEEEDLLLRSEEVRKSGRSQLQGGKEASQTLISFGNETWDTLGLCERSDGKGSPTDEVLKSASAFTLCPSADLVPGWCNCVADPRLFIL